MNAFKACYQHHVTQRTLITIYRIAAKFPLRISLFMAVEIFKTAWIELTASCIRNCFHNAGFTNVVKADNDNTGTSIFHTSISCMQICGGVSLMWS